MVILVTAPIGAAAISLSGPRLLKKQVNTSEAAKNSDENQC